RAHTRHHQAALRLEARHRHPPVDGHPRPGRRRHAALGHAARAHVRHAGAHRRAHRCRLAGAPGRGAPGRRAGVSDGVPVPRPRVVVAFGTRPEANKMAPVVAALKSIDLFDVLTLVTGQHRQQLDGSLATFGITADADLNVMTERQTLPDLVGRITPAAAQALKEMRADYVLVHGDTTTTFAVALAAFLEGAGVAHVEAGLRSFDMTQPFPEEANRRLTDVLTDLDLPPTEQARLNLLAEGKLADRMVVTGNTAVDAILTSRQRAQLPDGVPAENLVAVTMHRRENLPVMRGLAEALADVARAHPELTFVYPVHLNPAVRESVWAALDGLPNFRL